MAIDMISYLMGQQTGGGGTPSGEIEITENGEYDVTNYATANVNVAGGGIAGGYTVTFKVDGNDYYVASCQQGESITEPPIPTVEGKNFGGWQLDGVDITFPYTPNADIELTALLQTVRSEMEVYAAGTVLRTFDNREDTKTNNGTAVCGKCTYYLYGTQYFIMLVSKTIEGATYTGENPSTFKGSLTYDGETWYYRGNYSGGSVPISTNPAFYDFGSYTVSSGSDFAEKILDHYFYKD